jgi:hypothetical protein
MIEGLGVQSQARGTRLATTEQKPLPPPLLLQTFWNPIPNAPSQKGAGVEKAVHLDGEREATTGRRNARTLVVHAGVRHHRRCLQRRGVPNAQLPAIGEPPAGYESVDHRAPEPPLFRVWGWRGCAWCSVCFQRPAAQEGTCPDGQGSAFKL